MELRDSGGNSWCRLVQRTVVKAACCASEAVHSSLTEEQVWAGRGVSLHWVCNVVCVEHCAWEPSGVVGRGLALDHLLLGKVGSGRSVREYSPVETYLLSSTWGQGS